jgi:SAM-dependent methyltransferase
MNEPVLFSQLSKEIIEQFEDGWNENNYKKPGWVIDEIPFFDITPRNAYTHNAYDSNKTFGILGKMSKSLSGPNTLGCDIGCVDMTYASIMISYGIEKVIIFEPKLLNDTKQPQIELMTMDITREEYTGPKFDLMCCISTIEHIGLGRYGDPIDPIGDIKMMKAIYNMLKSDGRAILSFPYNKNPESVGIIRWNGCRIYNQFRKDLLFKDFNVVEETNLDNPQPIWVLKKKEEV